jgi:hypothetical protein
MEYLVASFYNSSVQVGIADVIDEKDHDMFSTQSYCSICKKVSFVVNYGIIFKICFGIWLLAKHKRVFCFDCGIKIPVDQQKYFLLELTAEEMPGKEADLFTSIIER